jgi:DNA-binding winged helix-turn-helix (wHTH) protein
MTSFGSYRVDLGTRQLLRDGSSVRLSPKALDLLVALLDARPRVVLKADLQERLWPDSFVAEANLSNLIAEVRAALGDNARSPQFIRTVHGYGYAFCGSASTDAPPAPDAGPQCWLAWGERRFPLHSGEHIVGRDEAADVRLDASTVSRRHARLMVERRLARLEDLGSKNGTFRSDERVSLSTRLCDGDLLRFGSVTLTFHCRHPDGTTDTQL